MFIRKDINLANTTTGENFLPVVQPFLECIERWRFHDGGWQSISPPGYAHWVRGLIGDDELLLLKLVSGKCECLDNEIASVDK